MEQSKQIKLLEGVYLVKLLKEVGLTIYPVIAPENASKEYIVYQRTSLDGFNLKGRITPLQKATYTINIVTDIYARGLDLTTKIITKLNDYQDKEIIDISINSLSESYQDDFIQTINLTLTI